MKTKSKLYELFTPTDEFIASISLPGEKIFETIDEFLSLDQISESGKSYKIFFDGVSKYLDKIYFNIKNSYNRTYDQPRLEFELYGLVHELFKNTYDHAASDTEIIMKTYVGSKGIGFGYHETTGFFKTVFADNLNKGKKIPSNATPNSPRRTNNTLNGGTAKLIRESDYLKVDIEKGVIYLTMLKNRFLRSTP